MILNDFHDPFPAAEMNIPV